MPFVRCHLHAASVSHACTSGAIVYLPVRMLLLTSNTSPYEG